MTSSRAAALALVVLSAACGDASGPAAPDGHPAAGLYSLVTINGRKLPFTVFVSGPVRVEIRGRRIALEADGSYTDEIDTAFFESGGVALNTSTREGRWVEESGFVTLRYADRTPLVARVVRDAMSFTDGDMLFRLLR